MKVCYYRLKLCVCKHFIKLIDDLYHDRQLFDCRCACKNKL